MALGLQLDVLDDKLYHQHFVLQRVLNLLSMPRTSALRQAANRARIPWRTPVPRRPHALLTKSAEVAREPTTLAELFTSALLNQDGLGCTGD